MKTPKAKHIGTTASGKPVYKNFGHDTHDCFTKQDHLDAAMLFGAAALAAGRKHMTSAERWQTYLHQQAATLKN